MRLKFGRDRTNGMQKSSAKKKSHSLRINEKGSQKSIWKIMNVRVNFEERYQQIRELYAKFN